MHDERRPLVADGTININEVPFLFVEVGGAYVEGSIYDRDGKHYLCFNTPNGETIDIELDELEQNVYTEFPNKDYQRRYFQVEDGFGEYIVYFEFGLKNIHY